MGPEAGKGTGMATTDIYTRNNVYQHFQVLKTNRNKRYRAGEFFRLCFVVCLTSGDPAHIPKGMVEKGLEKELMMS